MLHGLLRTNGAAYSRRACEKGVDCLAAQHKRPGRRAKEERRRRARERAAAKGVVVVGTFTRGKLCPMSPGRLVAWAEWRPEVSA